MKKNTAKISFFISLVILIAGAILLAIPFDYENSNFINCHASYVVNMNDIKAITDKSFTTKSGEQIPISKSMFSQVKKRYIQYLVGE